MRFFRFIWLKLGFVNEIYPFYASHPPIEAIFVHIFVYFDTQKTEYFILVNNIYPLEKNKKFSWANEFFPFLWELHNFWGIFSTRNKT